MDPFSENSRRNAEWVWFIPTVTVIFALIGGVVWFFADLVQRGVEPDLRALVEEGEVLPERGATENGVPALDGARVQVAERLADGRLILAEVAAEARQLNAPDRTATDDVELLQTLLEQYRRAHGGVNPAGGLNEEFADALRGRNARRLALLPPDHQVVNDAGQIVDRWGTPYFFHPLAADEVDIRSAGPDRRLWTGDDITPAADRQP